MEPEVKPKKEGWNWAKHRPNNCLNIPVTSQKDFFKWWCVMQCPFVPLTNRESDVVSAFLYERFELSKIVQDQEILDSQLMSDRVKERVMEACHITKAHFYVVMSALRKKHVVSEYGIHPKLIPNIRPDDNGYFQLLVLFKKTKQDDL